MALTKITGQVINDTTGLVVGVTTVGGGISATDGFFSGIVTAVGDASFSGNVSVGGTLTYEDVTNIDSVGLVTARNGIVVGSGITLSKDGDGFFTGVVTATSYAGDGSGLTGIAATDNVRTGILDVAGVGTFRNDVNVPDKIIHLGDTDTAIRFPAADTITAETGGTERLRITSDGKYQFPGTGGGSGARGLEIDTESIGAADEGVILNARASGNTGQIKLQTNSATAMTVEGNGGNVNVASNLKVAGVCTATSFSGSGANLTGISAISVIDSWRMTTSTSNGTNATVENWASATNLLNSNLGSSLTYSNGTFSFPSTGHYLMTFNCRIKCGSGNDGEMNVILKVTENNSSYSDAAVTSYGAGEGNTRSAGTITYAFDITDTSNQKFYFITDSFGSTSQLLGNSTSNETYFQIIRLADT